MFNKRILSCLLLSLLAITCASAAPTDMVPRGDAVNDWMASLAADGYLGSSIHPSEFTTEPLHTRGQLTSMLEMNLLDNSAAEVRLSGHGLDIELVRESVHYLQPELTMDGVDVKKTLNQLGNGSTVLSLTAQPEERISAGGGSQSKSGFVGIYRAVASGEAGPSTSYTLSLSNWYQDWRRQFYNDTGTHDFNELNEAYIDVEGRNNFHFKFGRMYDNWGPAWLGGTLLSDNSPPFNELEITFPFSLGRRLGRNYRYEQNASTFTEGGVRKYFEARRVEYQFSKRTNFDFEEAFKTAASRGLLATPLPFLLGKGVDESDFENYFNYSSNFGLNYAADANTRVYGQLYLDDIKSPFRGKFFGISLGNGGYTPQKINYVVGASTQTKSGTGLTLEYQEDDPTVYTFHTENAPWTHGAFDWIAMPVGPNSREYFGRLSQKLGKTTTIAFEDRDHRRRDNSYPAPTARDYGLYLTQQLGKRDSVELEGHDYRQDAFPFLPGQPGYPTQNVQLAPFAYANPGVTERIKQVDVSYSITF